MKTDSWFRQFDHSPWATSWRIEPSTACPAEASLHRFTREPLSLPAPSYSHIVRGCPSCRDRLHRLLLGPSST